MNLVLLKRTRRSTKTLWKLIFLPDRQKNEQNYVANIVFVRLEFSRWICRVWHVEKRCSIDENFRFSCLTKNFLLIFFRTNRTASNMKSKSPTSLKKVVNALIRHNSNFCRHSALVLSAKSNEKMFFFRVETFSRLLGFSREKSFRARRRFTLRHESFDQSESQRFANELRNFSAQRFCSLLFQFVIVNEPRWNETFSHKFLIRSSLNFITLSRRKEKFIWCSIFCAAAICLRVFPKKVRFFFFVTQNEIFSRKFAEPSSLSFKRIVFLIKSILRFLFIED